MAGIFAICRVGIQQKNFRVLLPFTLLSLLVVFAVCAPNSYYDSLNAPPTMSSTSHVSDLLQMCFDKTSCKSNSPPSIWTEYPEALLFIIFVVGVSPHSGYFVIFIRLLLQNNFVISFGSSSVYSLLMLLARIIAPGTLIVWDYCLLHFYESPLYVLLLAAMFVLSDVNFWLELSLVFTEPEQATIAIYSFLTRFSIATFWWMLFLNVLINFLPCSWYSSLLSILLPGLFIYNARGLGFNIAKGVRLLFKKGPHERRVVKPLKRKAVVMYLEGLDNDKIFDEVDMQSLNSLYTISQPTVLLGKGSFGEVVKAVINAPGQPGHRDEVAIKKLAVKASKGAVHAAYNLLMGALQQDVTSCKKYFEEILMEVNVKERAFLTQLKHEIRALKAISSLKHPSLIQIKSAHLFNGSTTASKEDLYNVKETEPVKDQINDLNAAIVCNLVIPICYTNINNNKINSSSSGVERIIASHAFSSKQMGPLFDASMTTKLSVIQTFFSAIAALHGSGIVHRDVKVDNLAVHSNFRDIACVLDVGTAFLPEGKDYSYKAGTPIYHAPERITYKYNDNKIKVGNTPTIQDVILALGAGVVNGWSGDVWAAALTAVEILTDVPRETFKVMAAHSNKTGSIALHAYMIYYMNARGYTFSDIEMDYKSHNNNAFYTWVNALNSWGSSNVDILLKHFVVANLKVSDSRRVNSAYGTLTDGFSSFKQAPVHKEMLTIIRHMLVSDPFRRPTMDSIRQNKFFESSKIGEYGPSYAACKMSMHRFRIPSSSVFERHHTKVSSSISTYDNSNIINRSSPRELPSRLSVKAFSAVDTTAVAVEMPVLIRSPSFEEELQKMSMEGTGKGFAGFKRRLILLRTVKNAILKKVSLPNEVKKFEVSDVDAIIREFKRVAFVSRIGLSKTPSINNNNYINNNSHSNNNMIPSAGRKNSESSVTDCSAYASSSSKSSKRRSSPGKSSFSPPTTSAPSSASASSSSSSSSSSLSPLPSSPYLASLSTSSFIQRSHSCSKMVVDKAGLESIFQATGLSSIFGIKSDVLFDYFDDDKSGSIDRKELMLGLSVFLDLYRCTDISTHATLVYHAFDANGDGVLSIQEFSALLDAIGIGIASSFRQEVLLKLFDLDSKHRSKSPATLERFIAVVSEDTRLAQVLVKGGI